MPPVKTPSALNYDLNLKSISPIERRKLCLDVANFFLLVVDEWNKVDEFFHKTDDDSHNARATY